VNDRRAAPRDTPDRRQGDRRVAPSLPNIVLTVATDKTLTPRCIHVFLVLFAQLDVLDYRRVKLAGMIKQLGMSKWRISRCVRQLRDRGYVEAGELDGAIRTYRLSTGVGILPECEVANLRQALAEVEAKARELASRRLGQHQWDLFTVAEMAKWAVRASEIRKAAA
jgi:hypothetical protein